MLHVNGRGENYWCNDCLHYKEGETPKDHSIFVYVWALSSSWTQCVTHGTWISILAFYWRSRKSILQTMNVSDTILPIDIGDVKCHCRWAEINLRRGCPTLLLLADIEREEEMSFTSLVPANKSLSTEQPWSVLISPLNRTRCGKASSPWGQLEGCIEKLSITKVAFIEWLSTRIAHNGCFEMRRLCQLQVCITAGRKMTNMACRRLYC